MEQRVHLLAVRHREVLVRAVVAALEVRPRREDLVVGAAVLANQAPQIGQALAAPERPERLLAEEQRRRGIASSPASSRAPPWPESSLRPIAGRSIARSALRIVIMPGMSFACSLASASYRRASMPEIEHHRIELTLVQSCRARTAASRRPRRRPRGRSIPRPPARADRSPTRTAARS